MKRTTFVALTLAATIGLAVPGMAQDSGQVVARYGDSVITASELEKAVGNSTLQARQQIYDAEVESLKGLIFDRLLSDAAAKANISKEQYLKQEIDDKAQEPDPAEAAKMVAQYRSRLPGDDAEALAVVKDFLKQQAEAGLRENLRQRLFEGLNLQILLQPPRVSMPLRDFNPRAGTDKLPITIVEFSEFQCPFCKRVKTALAEVKKKYPDQIHHVFKHLPLPMHREARLAAVASLCADDQGKFWPFHDRLFANQNNLKRDALLGHAAAIELDAAKFEACIDDPSNALKVDEDMRDAEQLGITGVPAFLINGRLLSGAQPAEEFLAVISSEFALAGIDLESPPTAQEPSGN